MNDDAELLMNWLEEAGLDLAPYSGRGMSDKECISIEVPHELDALPLFVDAAANAAKMNDFGAVALIRKAAENAVSDDMGKRVVVYFPKYKWPDA